MAKLLGDVIVCAKVQSRHRVRFLSLGGERDDGNVGTPSDLGERGEPVSDRHHDV